MTKDLRSIKRELEDLVDEVKSSDGKFQQIVNREVKYTFNYFSEIAKTFGEIMEMEEEDNPLSGIEASTYVSRIQNFWDRFDETFNEAYDWDFSDNLGGFIDGTLKVIYFPFALFGGLVGSTLEHIESKIKWEENLKSNIKNNCKKLKEILKNHEDEIQKLIEKKLKGILS